MWEKPKIVLAQIPVCDMMHPIIAPDDSKGGGDEPETKVLKRRGAREHHRTVQALYISSVLRREPMGTSFKERGI